MRTEPVFIHSGPQRISAAFINKVEGSLQDLMSPHNWSIASTSIADAYGFTSVPHLRDLAITEPYNPTGVSESPSREAIFSCRPAPADDAVSCAEEILARLASKAYRKPLAPNALGALMSLYEIGASDGGFDASFESGIRTALEGILASPHFVFRFEEPPANVHPGEMYRIRDIDLASRLSFFLWAPVRMKSSWLWLATEGFRIPMCSQPRPAGCWRTPARPHFRRASPHSGFGCRTWKRCIRTCGRIRISTTS